MIRSQQSLHDCVTLSTTRLEAVIFLCQRRKSIQDGSVYAGISRISALRYVAASVFLREWWSVICISYNQWTCAPGLKPRWGALVHLRRDAGRAERRICRSRLRPGCHEGVSKFAALIRPDCVAPSPLRGEDRDEGGKQRGCYLDPHPDPRPVSGEGDNRP